MQPLKFFRECNFLIKDFNITKSLKRLGIEGAIFIVASIMLNYLNYQAYWNQTLYSVQTIDFNMLMHSLPTKLSIALKNGDTEEIQRTIDSNLNKFGLVLTDCKSIEKNCEGQKILYMSGKPAFKAHLKVSDLNKDPYDILRDPPSLYAEQYYQYDFSNHPIATEAINAGKPIGRIYYVRVIPPNFFNDYGYRLFFSSGALGLAYRNMTFVLIFLWFFIYIVIEILIVIDKKYLKAKIQYWESRNKYLEAKNQYWETHSKFLEAKNQYWETHRKLSKLERFNDVLAKSINEEFSATGNELQKIKISYERTLRRIAADCGNLVHDLYKAPLLFDATKIDKLLSAYDALPPEQRSFNREYIQLLKSIDISFRTIDHVIKDLKYITDTESHRVCIQDELKWLENNLPPSISNVAIDFRYGQKTIIILCNPWHLKSIIKNALYNSTAILQEYQYQLEDNNQSDFHPKIVVDIEEDGTFAYIRVTDNGPGIPEDLISKLYQSDEKLNPAPLRGNGSKIVFAYLTLHEASARVTNLKDERMQIVGASVEFKFRLALP